MAEEGICVGETTAIAWTDHTFNPWWGCTKIAGPNGTGSACDFCYAEAFAKRTGHAIWGKESPRRFFGDKHWAEPLKWNRQAEAESRRHRVFCASMADVFESRDDLDEPRARLWDTITATPWLDWQLLTKRPENVLRMVDGWVISPERPDDWPANVWVGTTIEDQERADLRLPRLLKVDPVVRFLSCEPLLGPIDLTYWLQTFAIQWVICGGESGPHHRPLDLDAARSLRDQCATAGVPFFFKQNSGRMPGTAGPPDLEQIKEFPRG